MEYFEAWGVLLGREGAGVKCIIDMVEATHHAPLLRAGLGLGQNPHERISDEGEGEGQPLHERISDEG